MQRERATSYTQGNTLPLMPDPDDPDGDPIPSDQPFGFTDSSDLTGWTYSVYLQDEWRIVPTVTVNFGLRFDAINAATQENQLSPRINVVWQPNEMFTVRAGYSRYFTPPPLLQVSANSIATLAGTVAAPEVTTNTPVRAERADYFDVGVTAKPLRGLTVGLSAYYKIAQNLLDEGQFGAPISLTSFNYANAIVKGVEFNASYDEGPWSVYFNGAYGSGIGTNINSAQFNFGQAELAYIANNYISLDHSQGWTMSSGAAYTFNPDKDWATRVSADMLFGSGLRTSVVTPNDLSLPGYAVVNASLAQKLPIGLGKDDAGPFRRHQPVRQQLPDPRRPGRRRGRPAVRPAADLPADARAKILTHNRHDLAAPDVLKARPCSIPRSPMSCRWKAAPISATSAATAPRRATSCAAARCSAPPISAT